MLLRALLTTSKSVLALSCLAAMFSISAMAQGGGGASVSASPPAENKTLSPREELENKVRKSLKSPPEFVVSVSEFINKYPYSERAASYLYSLSRVIKDVKDAEASRGLVNQLVRNTEQTPEPLKSEIYRRSADALFGKGLFEDSALLSKKAINLFDDDGYLEFKQKQHEFTMAELTARNPKYKPRPFDRERTRGFYVGTKTDVYNLLGKSLWELGKIDQAEKAYRDSLAIRMSKNAALGIARASERNGRDAEALEYAAAAVLTGKADPEEEQYFRSLYHKLHPGKTEDIEDYLDALFKKGYSNPVRSEKYRATAKRSDRAVLAEFITGAGCVPCIPVDYTFETALKDYSPKELVLLVYHWHAPTWDPLGNYSSDSRVKYYGINSAPTVILNGKKSEKEGDYYGSDGEQNEIYEIAKGLNEEIRSELEVPANAQIKLRAKRDNQFVNVNVTADRMKNTSDDVSLQIALVENEVTYSGENGLRFQLMVVRALAGDNEKRIFGFKVDPSKANKVNYVFDVNKIVEQNLRYYDSYPVERMEELRKIWGGSGPEGFKVEFKYKKHQINPGNLSVVVFLQDYKTKKILQSSSVNLVSGKNSE
jgi:hypothetical protein